MSIPSSELLPALPEQDYLDLHARLAELKVETSTVVNEMMAGVSAYDPDTRMKVYDVFQQYGELRRQGGDNMPILSQFAQQSGRVPAATVAQLYAKDELDRQSETIKAQLENHEAVEKAGEIARQVAELEAHIDYDALIDQGDSLSGLFVRNDVYRIIAIRKLLESGTVFSLSDIKDIDSWLRQCSTNLQSSELLISDQELQTDDEQADEDRYVPHTKAEGEALIASFHTAADIAKKFSHNLMLPYAVSIWMDRATWQLEEMSTWSDTIDPEDITIATIRTGNERLQAAFMHSIATSLAQIDPALYVTDTNSETYRQLVDAARSIDVDKALDDLQIEGGLESLPFPLDQAEIRTFLKKNLPPLALQHTKQLVFRPLTLEENPDGKLMGRNGINKVVGGHEVTINTEYFERAYHHLIQDEGLTALQAADYIRLTFNNVLVHEFAHTLHDVLPTAALEQWVKDTVNDQTHITSYVKHTHDEDHEDKYREDFADSLSMFVTRPVATSVISRARFAGMMRLYRTFMPGYEHAMWRRQTRAISNAALRGSINGQVVEQFLAHESPEIRQAVKATITAENDPETSLQLAGDGFHVKGSKSTHLVEKEIELRTRSGEPLNKIKRDMAKRFKSNKDSDSFSRMTNAIRDTERLNR